MRLAVFVSAHGFGHAARTAAVLEALGAAAPNGLEATIWTAVPGWFFEDSSSGPVRLRADDVDVGLVQSGPFREDLDATAAALSALVPPPEERVERLAAEVRASGARAVLCDVSPLGLAVAARAGLPSVLLENFTWDWIYAGYRDARLAPFVAPLAERFATAGARIQATPICRRVAGAIEVPPISRRTRSARERVRRALGIGERERMVLVTLGGIPPTWEGLDTVRPPAGVVLVVPGASGEERRDGAVISLPHRSRFYHPDLLAAADGAVAKLGYSTVAEAWANGTPLAYFERSRFPESPVLARFVEDRMSGLALGESDLAGHRWAARLEELLALPRSRPGRPNGAEVAARAILALPQLRHG